MKHSWIALIFILILGSCEDELKVNTDWRDVSIIYGILDKSKDTNYVRIHRAYLGNEGITGGNQDPDSLYYDVLNVSIDEIKNGVVTKNIILVKDNSIALDSGFFTSKDYHTYRLDYQIKDGFEYRLKVDKPTDNLEPVYATAPVIADFGLIKPAPNPLVKLTYFPRGQVVSWRSAREGRLYQTIVRFYYTEVNIDNFSDSVRKQVDLVLPTKTAKDLNGGDKFEVEIDGEDYYKYLLQEIGVNQNVIRFYRGSDIYIAAAADDFATYMNVNAPSNSIIQDKPSFTNITGGSGTNAGIFSSSNWHFRYMLDLSTSSYKELELGDITCDLHFAYLDVATFDTCYCNGGTRICL